MRRIVSPGAVCAGLIAATAAAAPEPALPDPMEPAYANTIVATYPDGRQARLWLDRDGGYHAQGRRNDASSGHWNVRADKMCLRQSRPFPIPFAYCTPMVKGGVGTTWSARAFTGEAVTVAVVAGR